MSIQTIYRIDPANNEDTFNIALKFLNMIDRILARRVSKLWKNRVDTNNQTIQSNLAFPFDGDKTKEQYILFKEILIKNVVNFLNSINNRRKTGRFICCLNEKSFISLVINSGSSQIPSKFDIELKKSIKYTFPKEDNNEPILEYNKAPFKYYSVTYSNIPLDLSKDLSKILLQMEKEKLEALELNYHKKCVIL